MRTSSCCGQFPGRPSANGQCFTAINKPLGFSSAQVIRECQNAFSPSQYFKPTIESALKDKAAGNKKFNRKMKRAMQLKMGHGGTLDPLATGILILGIGQGTKCLSQFLDCVKTYEAVIVFGAATDTYDRVGRILTKRRYDHITRDKVLEALESFRGKQKQTPPLYSALKMDGKPLYEYAREGRPIPREIEAREVDVSELELLEWYEPGTHNHRWPTEEAEAAERNLAEQVWRIKKNQETIKKLTPEEKEEDDQAVAAHESFKRNFEERTDALIRDSPNKRQRSDKDRALMSGALGQLPKRERGKELIEGCQQVDPSTPFPWSDKGPPAMKVRMAVSSGFYVRSFCHDLGIKLDSAALMAELCRTRQSDFTVGGPNCLEYDDIKQDEKFWGPKVRNMLARWNGEPATAPETPAKATSPPHENGVDKTPSAAAPRQSVEANSQPASPQAKSPWAAKLRASSPLKRARSSSREGSPERNVKAKTRRSNSPGEKSWNGIQD